MLIGREKILSKTKEKIGWRNESEIGILPKPYGEEGEGEEVLFICSSYRNYRFSKFIVIND